MDPPLINEASFSAANPASYSLTGIWPNATATAGGLGLRIGNLGGGYGDLDLSVEESTVTEQSIGNGRKRRDFSSEGESSKLVSTSSSANELNDSNSKRIKASESTSGNWNSKAEGDDKKPSEQTSKSSEEPSKQDYIHVRARRGQATDSHSLAERARREKISKRMKMLQDLVPGCNKVIGKALVLDEIINYVQSLQRQVEFLSMKLEAVNSRTTINPSFEGFHPKNVGVQPFGATGMVFDSQSSRDYTNVSHPEWLHMQIGGNFEKTA